MEILLLIDWLILASFKHSLSESIRNWHCFDLVECFGSVPPLVLTPCLARLAFSSSEHFSSEIYSE